MAAKKDELDIGRIMIASAITFLTWKLLQATVGYRIDSHVETRQAKKNAAASEPQPTYEGRIGRGFMVMRR